MGLYIPGMAHIQHDIMQTIVRVPVGSRNDMVVTMHAYGMRLRHEWPSNVRDEHVVLQFEVDDEEEVDDDE